jgi:glycosyltransferase involved in cell wall biosynthesis
LRIALLTYRGNPFSGGQGVYVRALSRALRDLGHEVTVLSGPPYAEVDEGVGLVKIRGLDLYARLGERGLGLGDVRGPVDLCEWVGVSGGLFPEPLTFGLRAAQHLMRHDGFDVIHDNQSLSWPLLGLQAAGTPVVATIHHPIHIDRDLAFENADSWLERFRLWRWYSFLPMQEQVARRLPAVISVSETSGRDATRAFGLAPGRVRTVYNGVDPERFRPSPRARRERDRVLVVNSADTPIKGLDQLYGALGRLLRRRALDVRIVGRPMHPKRTERALERNGIAGKVTFLGRLDDEALVAEYSSATVAVLPSVYEGFGFPAAEAMACEAPVVAYAAGALPEVIGPDGVAGRLVPKGDQAALALAIEQLLDHPEAALMMGKVGRERVVTRFQWKEAARRTADVYAEAIACSR